MSCEKYREAFDSVIDGELKESRKKKFFAHLEECQSCSLEFKLYEKVVSGVEGLDEVDAPPDLTAVVMKGIVAQPPPWQGSTVPAARWVPGSWAWAGAFAVVLLATVLSFVSWDSRPVQVATQPPAATIVRDEVPALGQDPVRDDLVVKPTAATVPQGTGLLLVRHQGDVEVLDLATSSWKAIGEQAYLNFGDRIRTGSDGTASLEYERERVSLRVKPSSVLQVLDRQTLRVFAGTTWVNVKRKGTVFRTETPNAIASVRGTKYSVEVRPMADLFSSQSVRVVDKYVDKPYTPAPTADLAVYSTMVGLAMMKGATGIDIVGRTESEIKVFESVVNVVAKDSKGVEKQSIDIEEGFRTQIQLASVGEPKPLSEADFFAWNSVMPFDQGVLERARAKVAASTNNPPTATTAEPAGPVSESERPAGFEDIHRR